MDRAKGEPSSANIDVSGRHEKLPVAASCEQQRGCALQRREEERTARRTAVSELGTAATAFLDAVRSELDRREPPQEGHGARRGLQVQLLDTVVDARRPMPLTVLADSAAVSVSAVRKAVAALEVKGWVTRQTSPTDRRYVEVSATAHGTAVVADSRALMGEVLNDQVPVAGEQFTALVEAAGGLLRDLTERIQRRRYQLPGRW